MKIYTKTGDDGETGLFGGARVKKDDSRVEAYGTVDETNAALGVARASGLPEAVDEALERVQQDLFAVGAELGCSDDKRDALRMTLIADSDVARLERLIDESEARLSPLKTFVLPGGSPAAASLHQARTICRRAERCCVHLAGQAKLRPCLLVYLNRLSDLLFVLARVANLESHRDDVPWNPR